MSNSKKIVCQNCQKEFIIESSDFDFYEKISPSQIFAKGKNLGGQGVPAPTWCWECRTIRRMLWRNERSLYNRKSDLSGQKLISLYPKEAPFKVYSQKEWWSDQWDGLKYGRDYDFSQPFFQQFHELQKEVPRIAIFNVQCSNSDYTNQSYQNKNCYLCFSIADSEDSAYAANINKAKQVYDSLFVSESELVYEGIDSERCYKCSFISNCENCIESSFLFDCKNCQHCIGGVGLRNKQYVFWGKQLSKDEFEQKKKAFDLAGFHQQQQAKEKFPQFILGFPRKAQRFKKCVKCTGDFLRNSKNVKAGFNAYDLEDCAYISRIYTCKDSYDNYGLGESELAYETIGSQNIYDTKWASIVTDCRNAVYCDSCAGCENCFGCVGLRHKQYCILNKQYTKEEYEQLVPRIIEHMNKMPYKDKKGRTYKYGEFFPPEISPFAYNETIAQEYFPLTKEQALEQGYRWKDPEPRDYKIDIKTEDLPDNIKDVPDDIVGKVIECANAPIRQLTNCELTNSNPQSNNPQSSNQSNCTTAFKITPQELDFYRKMGLPLPRYCPNCRHYQRLKQRNPLKLWQRQCQCVGSKSSNGVYSNTTEHSHGQNPCPNTFQTTYSPDRPEIVYCKECYQREVA